MPFTHVHSVYMLVCRLFYPMTFWIAPGPNNLADAADSVTAIPESRIKKKLLQFEKKSNSKRLKQ